MCVFVCVHIYIRFDVMDTYGVSSFVQMHPVAK